MNSRLTLCMTLHIKGDKELKNTNLETKGDKKFDVVNQYHDLELTDKKIRRKIVATIEKRLMKYVLRICIYREMIMVAILKMHNGQFLTIRKSQ